MPGCVRRGPCIAPAPDGPWRLSRHAGVGRSRRIADYLYHANSCTPPASLSSGDLRRSAGRSLRRAWEVSSALFAQLTSGEDGSAPPRRDCRSALLVGAQSVLVRIRACSLQSNVVNITPDRSGVRGPGLLRPKPAETAGNQTQRTLEGTSQCRPMSTAERDDQSRAC
jgi:hypothetical protein